MHTRDDWPPVVDLIERVVGEDDMLPSVVAAVRTMVQEIAALPAADIAGHTRALLAAATRALAARRGPTEAELSFVEELAVTRARQGVSIEAVLAAVHVAERAIWSRARELAGSAGVAPERLLDARELYDDWAEAVRVRLITAHRATGAGQGPPSGERDAALLRRLFAGGSAAALAAAEAGLPAAAALNPAAEPAPPPWWRTVWPPRRRARAGSGRAVRFLVTLAAVAAVCAGALLLLPAGRTAFEDARDKMGKPRPVTPVGIEASAEVPRHPAVNTTDGVSNRYWGAPAPGASVTYTFREPFRLVDMIIINGASKSPEDYARQARALRVDLEVTGQDGTRHREKLTLGDKPGPQTFPLGISDVKTVRLVLRSAVDLTEGRHLALAEVEFFRRG
ncbi:NADase-type glycan-binding domain-containing protein [Streptomyces barkulensis]|uniref:NADase-type glycan-binding domain-containing protein n=1 Tax=Streptomyces barkulensis TaxID=1257026 RepID=UPI0019CF6930|nr:hypothetical protein [Streptomyces barkulensis]